MSIETKTETSATFGKREEAIAFATKAMQTSGNYRVWFSDHYWEKDGDPERYEVTIARRDSTPWVATVVTESLNEAKERILAGRSNQ